MGNKSGKISKISILFFDKILFPISKFIDKITLGKIIRKNMVIVAGLIK